MLLDLHDADARGVVRCFLRHEGMAVRVALARASHHAVQRHQHMATQTDFVPAATYAATPAPSPVIDCVVSAPVVNYVAPAPVIEYVSSAPVIENIAPAPAVTLSVQSQQLPPVYTTTTVTTDVTLDFTGLVNPQFSITAVEASAPKVVCSLPPSEEFDAPVYNQIHQEQIAAGETTQNIVEIPVVHEQVIAQEIPQAPQIIGSFLLLEEIATQIDATVQTHVVFQEIPLVQVVERIQEHIVEPIASA